jgi:hypothetical protein
MQLQAVWKCEKQLGSQSVNGFGFVARKISPSEKVTIPTIFAMEKHQKM